MDNPMTGNGSVDDLEIKCPRCGSTNVAISADSKGYFEVVECHKCGYVKNSL